MGITDFLKSFLPEEPPPEPIRYPVGSPRLSPEQIRAYDEALLPLEEQLAERLEGLTWLKIFDRRSIEERQQDLQRVVDLYAEVFGFRQAQVLLDRNRRPVSWYGPGTILLDTRMIAALSGAVATALHEGTHNFQRSVVNRLKRGEIDPRDSLHSVARVWEFNFQHYLSPRPGNIAQYERQPVEFFANRFARSLMDRVSYLHPS